MPDNEDWYKLVVVIIVLVVILAIVALPRVQKDIACITIGSAFVVGCQSR